MATRASIGKVDDGSVASGSVCTVTAEVSSAHAKGVKGSLELTVPQHDRVGPPANSGLEIGT